MFIFSANKLSPADAVALLRTYGATEQDLGTHKGLSKFRKRIALKHHPDRGGDPEKFQAFNSAINLLLKRPESARPAETEVSVDSASMDEFEGIIKQARDLGFFRIQIRGMEPYPSMFWKQTGYFGHVQSTQTARRTGRTAKTDAEVAEALLKYVRYTASKVGQKGDPLDRIIKITVRPPRGRNTGWFAMAWRTAQDSLARDFGHSTRWYSITMDMPPGDAKKWLRRQQADHGGAAAATEAAAKKEKWNHSKVAYRLRESGLAAISGWDKVRWAPRGTPVRGIKDKPHIVLSTRTVKTWRHRQLYFGELTQAQLDVMIRWAGGDPPKSGQAAFIQPADIPISKAKAVHHILHTNGSGSTQDWELMDAWVAADGIRVVLEQIGRVYATNNSSWSSGEKAWWISQLS